LQIALESSEYARAEERRYLLAMPPLGADFKTLVAAKTCFGLPVSILSDELAEADVESHQKCEDILCSIPVGVV